MLDTQERREAQQTREDKTGAWEMVAFWGGAILWSLGIWFLVAAGLRVFLG